MSNEASAEVTEAIESLRDEQGFLLPEKVVEAARDPASPLHSHFEWKDERAASLYRLSQARTLIRTLKIPVRIGPATVTSVAYVPAPKAAGSYQRLDEIEPRSDTARAVVLAELGRVASALSRARKIATVVNLDEEIDLLIESLAMARHRIEVAEPAPATAE